MKRGKAASVVCRRRSGTAAITPMVISNVSTAVMEATGALVCAETHSRQIPDPLEALACECACTASMPTITSISTMQAKVAQRCTRIPGWEAETMISGTYNFDAQIVP